MSKRRRRTITAPVDGRANIYDGIEMTGADVTGSRPPWKERGEHDRYPMVYTDKNGNVHKLL